MHRFATLAVIIATAIVLGAVAFAGTAPWMIP
jgi:hypothetical protein